VKPVLTPEQQTVAIIVLASALLLVALIGLFLCARLRRKPHHIYVIPERQLPAQRLPLSPDSASQSAPTRSDAPHDGLDLRGPRTGDSRGGPGGNGQGAAQT
jgi:hypothetical protein